MVTIHSKVSKNIFIASSSFNTIISIVGRPFIRLDGIETSGISFILVKSSSSNFSLSKGRLSLSHWNIISILPSVLIPMGQYWVEFISKHGQKIPYERFFLNSNLAIY